MLGHIDHGTSSNFDPSHWQQIGRGVLTTGKRVSEAKAFIITNVSLRSWAFGIIFSQKNGLMYTWRVRCVCVWTSPKFLKIFFMR